MSWKSDSFSQPSPTHTLHILLRFVCHHATHHAGAPWLNVTPMRQMASAIALSRKKGQSFVFFPPRGIEQHGGESWRPLADNNFFFFFILIIIIRDATISKCGGTIIKPGPREDIYSDVKLKDNNWVGKRCIQRLLNFDCYSMCKKSNSHPIFVCLSPFRLFFISRHQETKMLPHVRF